MRGAFYVQIISYPAWLVELDEEGVDGDVLQVSPPLGDQVALHGVQREHQAPRLVHAL